jgi:hypothetical protein
MKKLEEKFEMDKELPSHYPLVNLGGKVVRYDPNKHELEKGESAVYFDFEEQKIKEGTIEVVEHSNPFNYPVYVINGNPHMHHRVWPKVKEEENKANLSAKGTTESLVNLHEYAKLEKKFG